MLDLQEIKRQLKIDPNDTQYDSLIEEYLPDAYAELCRITNRTWFDVLELKPYNHSAWMTVYCNRGISIKDVRVGDYVEGYGYIVNICDHGQLYNELGNIITVPAVKFSEAYEGDDLSIIYAHRTINRTLYKVLSQLIWIWINADPKAEALTSFNDWVSRSSLGVSVTRDKSLIDITSGVDVPKVISDTLKRYRVMRVL